MTDPETRTVSLADGRRLAYVEHGAPDGEAVVLFHGTPACRLGNDFVDGPARDLGLRVLVPDRPGVGRSDPKPDRSILDWADDVAGFADALGIGRFGVMGYSCGGPYAIACAQRLPDRLLGVSTMAGVGPVDREGARDGIAPSDAKMADLAVRKPGRARLELRILALGARLSPRAAIKSFAKECAPVDLPILEGLDDIDFFVEACRGGAHGVVREYQLWAEPWDFAWSAISQPVQLYQGTADTFVPMHHAEDLRARLPNATLHVLDGEGHVSIQAHAGRILAAAAGRG